MVVVQRNLGVIQLWLVLHSLMALSSFGQVAQPVFASVSNVQYLVNKRRSKRTNHNGIIIDLVSTNLQGVSNR